MFTFSDGRHSPRIAGKEAQRVRIVSRVWLTLLAGLLGLTMLFQVACSGPTPPPAAPTVVPAKVDPSGMPVPKKPVLYNLREISRKQVEYSGANGKYGTFAELVQAGLLDSRFNAPSPHIDYYTFKLDVTPTDFTIRATPDDDNLPGYYSGLSGDIFTTDGKLVPFEQQ